MTRKLIITGSRTIAAGEKNGKPWTLYGIDATDPQGNPIDASLKSFSNLPTGEVEVEVEVQESEQYGTSYMLKAAGRRSSSSSAGELAELRERISRLESEVKRLASTPALGKTTPVIGIPEDPDDIPF